MAYVANERTGYAMRSCNNYLLCQYIYGSVAPCNISFIVTPCRCELYLNKFSHRLCVEFGVDITCIRTLTIGGSCGMR